MDISKHFKKIFEILKKNKRLVLVSIILLFVSLVFFEQVKKIIFVMIFIAISSISKLYHRIIKSTVIIDIVLFVTMLTALVYKNSILGLVVAIPSLILSDQFARKLSHFSLVSIFGLIIIVFLSQILLSLPLNLAMIILTIVYEIYAIAAYYLLGSSPSRILIFFVSHFVSNMILIFSFAKPIAQVML